jgi:hypothetical protein
MSTSGPEAVKPQSKRDRAFLGQLPSDFLRVDSATAPQSSTGCTTKAIDQSAIRINNVLIVRDPVEQPASS